MSSFLSQAAIYLAAAVVAVPIASRLGLGSVLGYLLAGIVIGPVIGLVGAETQEIQHFAEFGVVMLLFLIGLELDPRGLWDMRHRLLGLGGLQIALTIALIYAGMLALGQPHSVALALGVILSLSSTAIVLQTLNEKQLMQTNGGRSAFSVLLTQDIAVIPMLALLPLLAMPATATLAPDGSIQRPGDHADDHHGEVALSLVEGLPGWGVTLVTIAAVILVILFGMFALRPLFRFVHLAKLPELYTAFALLIVIGIAVIMEMVGLSPALGAFLGGVVLANSEFRHQMESSIEPFKGLLLGLFFITVGAGINFNLFFNNPLSILGLTFALMFIKGLVLYALTFVFNLKRRDRWLFTLGLAQSGEFGFVLVSFSIQQNVLPGFTGQMTLLVIAFSMLLTPLFFIAYERLATRLGAASTDPEHDEIDDQQPIIVAGVGRFGQVLNRFIKMAGYKTVVLDNNLATIELMRRFGFKGFFGDPTKPELLHAAGLANARVLVVAIDDPEAAVQLVTYAKQQRPDLFVVARATHRTSVYQLQRAGADKVVREVFDSSLRAARYVVEHMGIPDFQAQEMEHAFFVKDRQAIRELAELWDPNIPGPQNEAYLKRSQELNRELEATLSEHLDQKTDKAG